MKNFDDLNDFAQWIICAGLTNRRIENFAKFMRDLDYAELALTINGAEFPLQDITSQLAEAIDATIQAKVDEILEERRNFAEYDLQNVIDQLQEFQNSLLKE